MEKKEVTAEELAQAFIDYDMERDAEWEFADEHGIDDCYWNASDVEEHQRIIDSIEEKRRKVNELLKRIKDDPDFHI